MTSKLFDQQDRSLMEHLKTVREKRIPPAILKGFSASVVALIREKQPSLEIKMKPKKSWVPVWAPVFAVLIIGCVLVLRLPIASQGIPLMTKTVELAQANTNQLSDEIVTLSELGVWTEDDEKSSGVPTENDTDELELSKAISHSDTKLT